ncbi:chymotrypsinogen B-like [Convolutriloba macropyga]|uniref:chymotrypsinogen B-like n=1 Tax=Convolutriloba macropyga TaxID=536237 RepID=UPI003F523A14
MVFTEVLLVSFFISSQIIPVSNKIFAPLNIWKTISTEKSALFLVINGMPTKRRPFLSVLKTYHDDFNFCGATIITSVWALTSANCVADRNATGFYLEFGHFRVTSSKRGIIYQREIGKIITHPSYQAGVEPRNDIALLKFQRELPALIPAKAGERILPICRSSPDIVRLGRRLFGFAGFGLHDYTQNPSATINRLKVPREIYLYESRFASVSQAFGIELCREDNVCVETSLSHGWTNICHYDIGGPLYLVEECEEYNAVCVYGVASFFRNLSSYNVDEHQRQICNGGSYFASVVHFQDWIIQTIANN